MKKNLTKLGYMAFGCLLTLIGYHFGNIDNNSVNAQENSPIIDEVRCRRLVIVGDDNTSRIDLTTDTNDSGMIELGNKHGIRRLFLGVNASDGVEAGSVQIVAEGGNMVCSVGSDAFGGSIAIYNLNSASNKPVVYAATTQTESGAVVANDKAGQQISSMNRFDEGGVIQMRDLRRVRNVTYLRK